MDKATIGNWSLIMKRVEVLRNQGLRVIQDGDRTTIKPVTGCSIKGFKKIDILEKGAYESLYKALSLYYKWEASAYGNEVKSIETQIGDRVKFLNLINYNVFRSDLDLYVCHIEGDLLFISDEMGAPKEECETAFVEDCQII